MQNNRIVFVMLKYEVNGPFCVFYNWLENKKGSLCGPVLT